VSGALHSRVNRALKTPSESLCHRFFTLAEPCPSAEALALLLSYCKSSHHHRNGPKQVCACIYNKNFNVETTFTDSDENMCMCALLSNYSDKNWNRERPLRLWPFPCFKRQDLFKYREPVTIQFMFRYAVLSDAANSNIWPQRLRTIPSFRGGTGNTDMKATSIVERRHLLFMKYFPGRPEPNNGEGSEPPYHFTLISLGPLQHNESRGIMRTLQSDEAKKAGELAPFVLFIRYLRVLFLAYTEEWDDIIARLDEEISFKVCRQN
jgi:hypothetical protein